MNIKALPSKVKMSLNPVFVKQFRLSKTLIAGLLVILALMFSSSIAKSYQGCQVISPALLKCPTSNSTSLSIWYVTASGLGPENPLYGLVDADNIQKAIDLALPGDTIVLKAGTFVFAKENIVDIGIATASGSFMLYEDFHTGPGWDSFYATPIHYQSINLNKEGLTLMGEVDSSGQLLTKITTPLNIDDHGEDFWDGYNGSFIINARYVKISNLEVEKFTDPIFAFSPGFDISGNRFVNCGAGFFLIPDNELTYPNWPKTNSAIQSYFRNNKIFNTAQAPHMVGSEIVVQNNYFEYYNFGLVIFPWGNYNDADNVIRHEPFPINWDLGKNNLVEGNFFKCVPNIHNSPLFGVGIWNWTSDLIDNKVINNVFRDCASGVYVADFEPADKFDNSGSKVTGNTFIDVQDVAVDLWSYVDSDGVRDAIVSENKFQNVGFSGYYPGGIWVEEGVKHSSIFGNDYTDSGRLGWAVDSGLIYLAPMTKGNQIAEFLFPVGLSMCDQIIDDGSNSVVGYGVCKNNPEQALHFQEKFTELRGFSRR